MNPEEQPVRRTSRIRKRTSKGEAADAELDMSTVVTSSSTPLRNFHPRVADSSIKMAPRRDRVSVDGTGRRGRRKAPPTNGPCKKSKSSSMARRDTVLSVADLTTLAHTTSRVPATKYQLPSLDEFFIAPASSFFDDGADEDWRDFAGNVDDWHKRSIVPAERAMVEAVASTFVSRAHKAALACVSWETFLGTERRIDSAKAVGTEPKKRASFLRDALDNELRLAILKKIAQRLCIEVFRESWREGSDFSASATLPAADSEENYEADPDRSVSAWRSGGPQGAIPSFDDYAASESSSEVDLNEEWMLREDGSS